MKKFGNGNGNWNFGKFIVSRSPFFQNISQNPKIYFYK